MASRSVCLDTDILIDHLRGNEEYTSKIEALEETSILSTTAINVFELYYGAHKRRSVEGARAIARLLGQIRILDVNGDVAEKAGEIAAQLEREGAPLDFGDLLIGATAITNDVELLTRNVKHFERIRGLKIIR